jgi:dTDP-4-dehydrorhamnose reductase
MSGVGQGGERRLTRVLVTGAGGMLGNAIVPSFRLRFTRVLATDKLANEPWLEELDLRDAPRVEEVFEEFEPDLVLHLAAETDLEFCEANPRTAEEVNARSTATVARLAEERGASLVYISTAGVFDGRKDDLYTESDEPNPIMVYGRTKLEGELNVRRLCRRHYVVRAGWMVGGGPGKDHKFVSKILEQIAGGQTRLHAVNDKWGTPTYTHDFAANLLELVRLGRHGTYHMVCEGYGTRFDVAREIVAVCGRHDVSVAAVDSSYFQAEYPAPRPRSEMLRNANLSQLGINRMRGWREALRAYIEAEYPHLLDRSAARGRFESRGAAASPRAEAPEIG